MAVISINIIEASEQLIAGFPKTIALSTNVPATIFYTVDGSTPTNLSSIYIDPIILPTDVLDFTLKAFATDGINSSAVITSTYSTDILNNTRLPHAAVPFDVSVQTPSLFPFGSNSPSLEFDYLNNAKSGTTVSNSSSTTLYGYDANGNPININKPADDYLNVYSTTDNQNKVYKGVGNLPGEVIVAGRRSALEYTPQSSNRSSGLFNPKAMVIFQDATDEDPTNPPQINRQSFSLENLEIVKDGAPLRATGLETPTITGSFLRSHYNPRTQMITSYYRDSSTNRWIISSYPYEPKQADPGNLSSMVFSRNDQGVGKVYSWNLFRYRTLT